MEQIEAKILGRDYTLAVDSSDKGRLLDAVRLVDERMQAIRDAGRIAGVDRIAVMAALQIAHDLLGSHAESGTAAASAGPAASAAVTPETLRRIRKLTADIDAELERQDSLF